MVQRQQRHYVASPDQELGGVAPSRAQREHDLAVGKEAAGGTDVAAEQAPLAVVVAGEVEHVGLAVAADDRVHENPEMVAGLLLGQLQAQARGRLGGKLFSSGLGGCLE